MTPPPHWRRRCHIRALSNLAAWKSQKSMKYNENFKSNCQAFAPNTVYSIAFMSVDLVMGREKGEQTVRWSLYHWKKTDCSITSHLQVQSRLHTNNMESTACSVQCSDNKGRVTKIILSDILLSLFFFPSLLPPFPFSFLPLSSFPFAVKRLLKCRGFRERSLKFRSRQEHAL